MSSVKAADGTDLRHFCMSQFLKAGGGEIVSELRPLGCKEGANSNWVEKSLLTQYHFRGLVLCSIEADFASRLNYSF